MLGPQAADVTPADAESTASEVVTMDLDDEPEAAPAADDEKKTCPQCGAPVSDDALFCNKCGAQL